MGWQNFQVLLHSEKMMGNRKQDEWQSSQNYNKGNHHICSPHQKILIPLLTFLKWTGRSIYINWLSEQPLVVHQCSYSHTCEGCRTIFFYYFLAVILRLFYNSIVVEIDGLPCFHQASVHVWNLMNMPSLIIEETTQFCL